MILDKAEKLKDYIDPLLSAMRDFSNESVQREIEKLLIPECQIKMCFPFGEIKGKENYFETTYKPLFRAFPNLERRDLIILAGETTEGSAAGSDERARSDKAA